MMKANKVVIVGTGSHIATSLLALSMRKDRLEVLVLDDIESIAIKSRPAIEPLVFSSLPRNKKSKGEKKLAARERRFNLKLK